MAIQQTAREFCPFLGEYRAEYLCDTEADVASLPACCVQSTAIVADSGDVWIVNASGELVKVGGA